MCALSPSLCGPGVWPWLSWSSASGLTGCELGRAGILVGRVQFVRLWDCRGLLGVTCLHGQAVAGHSWGEWLFWMAAPSAAPRTTCFMISWDVGPELYGTLIICERFFFLHCLF